MTLIGGRCVSPSGPPVLPRSAPGTCIVDILSEGLRSLCHRKAGPSLGTMRAVGRRGSGGGREGALVPSSRFSQASEQVLKASRAGQRQQVWGR